MRTAPILSKSIFLVAMLSLAFIAARAQKVDNVQDGNYWPPAAVKVDGKLTEWGAHLKAFNKTLQVWYTVANDDKNIYVAIRVDDKNSIAKIMAGGISFAINTEGKKKEKNAFIITYPVITQAGGRGRFRRNFGQQQDAPDSAAIVAQQKQTLAASKQISALGFKEITDTLISIYNEYGIKAAANIDDKGAYVYEVSVPLTMLGLSVTSAKEIAYDIKANGLQFSFPAGFTKVNIGGGGGGISVDGGGRGGGGGGSGFGGGGSAFSGGSAFGGSKSKSPDMTDLTNPTDFWGKYTLATTPGK